MTYSWSEVTPPRRRADPGRIPARPPHRGSFGHREIKTTAAETDDLRQLVHRFERLAENTLDAQQRVAVDLAELRGRAATIEQILRTVQ